MTRNCKHPTCGSQCRRPVKPKKVYHLQRTPIQRKPYTIKKESTKRARINKKDYAPNAKAFREANPKCLIKAPGCTKQTQGVHHVKGKATIELLLDQTFWMPACNHCNNYVEAHTQWAVDKGFKIPDYDSKLTSLKK